MFDTNIIISAALFPNERMNKFLEIISTEHQLFICTYSLDELERVVKRKFLSRMKNLELFLQKLHYTLIHTPTVDILDLDISIRDKKDYPVIISAITADVDILITGDKDFDSLSIERPIITTISDFIKSYIN